MERSGAVGNPRTPARRTRGRGRPGRALRRLSTVLTVGAAIGVALPGTAAGASASSPTPGLKKLLAEAAKISYQIDALGQQYDSLRIQFNEAKEQVRVAHLTVRLDDRILRSDQASIAKIAAAGYMTGGMDPAIQLLQSTNPQAMLDRASILTELQRQNSDQLNLVAAAREDAQRAKLLAVQEEHHAATLSKAMAAKVAIIQKKEDVLNSAAFSQAMAIYDKTGSYPNIHVTGDSVGVQALREALTRVGDPYVWAAAGPSEFDCSGLVVWSYAQIGISLPHFTGDLWNEGVHVSRSQLEPGDLVFFFPDIGHVGIYVGDGEMVDAPTQGQDVQVQPVFWSAYVGAVRIA